jgi:succinoglycan biosynthesis transport protein ExoP
MSINVRTPMRTVAKHLTLPMLGLAAGVVGAGVVTTIVPPSYQATASVIIMPVSAEPSDVTNAQNLAPTVARIAQSREVAQDVAGVLGVSTEDMIGHISGTYDLGIQIVALTATAPTAQQAATAANAAADAIRDISARLRLGGQSAVAVQNFDKAGVPTEPMSPKPGLNLALGAFVGVLAGLGLGSVRSRIDDRFRRIGDIEAELGLPVLGSLVRQPRPRVHKVQKLYANPRVAASVDAMVASVTVLSAGRRRIVVAGVTDDGSAAYAGAMLALGLSRHQGRTTLIEEPSAKPLARKYFPGLAEESVPVLLGRHRSVDPHADWLAVAPADVVRRDLGTTEPHGAGVGALVDALAATGDYVVVTAPPALSGAGLSALARHADAVLLVVAADRMSKVDTGRAALLAQRLGAPLVGVVVVGSASLESGIRPASWPAPVSGRMVPRPANRYEELPAVARGRSPLSTMVRPSELAPTTYAPPVGALPSGPLAAGAWPPPAGGPATYRAASLGASSYHPPSGGLPSFDGPSFDGPAPSGGPAAAAPSSEPSAAVPSGGPVDASSDQWRAWQQATPAQGTQRGDLPDGNRSRPVGDNPRRTVLSGSTPVRASAPGPGTGTAPAESDRPVAPAPMSRSASVPTPPNAPSRPVDRFSADRRRTETLRANQVRAGQLRNDPSDVDEPDHDRAQEFQPEHLSAEASATDEGLR